MHPPSLRIPPLCPLDLPLNELIVLQTAAALSPPRNRSAIRTPLRVAASGRLASGACTNKQFTVARRRVVVVIIAATRNNRLSTGTVDH